MTAVAALLLTLIGTDRLGDPLGPGVSARYGTTRLCHLKEIPPDPPTPAVVPKRRWSIDSTTAELRAYATDNGRLVAWRPLSGESDTDPQHLRRVSADGRWAVHGQFRWNEKADRYRGYPECFVHVHDLAAGPLHARYAFRFDDTPTQTEGDPDGEKQVLDVSVSDDGRQLAWADGHGRLHIRNLPSGRVVTALGTGYGSRKIHFRRRGAELAVLDRDNIILLIDPHTGRFQHAADNPATAAKQTAISPDGKLVATGHACGEVWVWDAVTGKPLWHTEPDGEAVRELHFNPTGTTVSAVGFWGPIGVRTWNAKTGKELGPMLPYRYFRTISVSPDGQRIADLIEEKSVMEKGQWAYPLFVRTREVATGKEVGRVRLDHRLGLGNENNAVVSRDGRVMVVTHNADGGETIAYDTATGKRLCQMQPSNGSLAVSHDGRLAVSFTNGKDGGHVWDTWTGSEIAVIDAPLLTQADVGFSPCGRFLATRSGFANLPVTWVFDVRSRQPTVFRGLTIAAFFPDGKSVLTLPGIRGAERLSLEPLAWTVAPPAKPSDARLKRLWTQLGEPAALDAVFELARHSAEAVSVLKAKLLTEPPDAKAVAAHVERLGSKLFADREGASKALRELGPETLPALRAALKAGPSPEVRSRLEKLLALHADTAAPFTLARLRAVEVLERCGTPDARAALKTLADTLPGTPWADDAARALVRREGVKN